jgi:DNA ligase (NAD+)
MHRCPNTSCPAQFFELLKHFVSKGAMDIDGLGEQWCRVFIDQGLVKDLADLYYLQKEQLLALERMGDKLATKITRNIEASKERPLPRVLFALGISHVGAEVAELLTQRHPSLDDLARANPEQLTQIPGIGPKIAESVAGYFQVPGNLQVLEKLRRAGVTASPPSPSPFLMERGSGGEAGGPPLHGLTFVITGTLASMTRREGESRIKSLGGSVGSAVTRKTNYLVAGESPGSKLDAAQRLGAAVLDEAAFLELLDRASGNGSRTGASPS